MEEPPGPSRTAEDTEPRAPLCDSPPTRRRASRWQQLKAGWAEGNNISTDADQDRPSPSNSPDRQLLQSLVLRDSTWSLNERDCQTTGLAAPGTDAADVLKRCADLQDSFLHSSHATDCAGADTASDCQLRIGPDGSLQWGAESSEDTARSAADTLLKLLQTDPSTVLDTLTSRNQGVQALPRQSSVRASDSLQHRQQQLDLTGVFDYLHQQQQQRHQQQRHATMTKRARRPPPSISSVAGNKQPSEPSSSSIREAQAGGRAGSQGGRTAAAQPQFKSPATAQKGDQHTAAAAATAAGRPTAGATGGAVSTKVNQAQAVGMPAPRRLQHSSSSSSSSSRVSSGQGHRTTATSSTRMAFAARPTGGSNASACSMPGSSTAKTRTTRHTTTQQPTGSAAPAVGAQQSLQQQVSTTSSKGSSTSSSSMCELQAELQLELGAVLLFRLLQRWRLAAADTALDKARARPMRNLLSKRKAMRAWRLAMAAPSPKPSKQPARLAPKQQPPQPCQHQQQLSHQPSQGGVKRMQVASQFHRMYRQHCCLLHWHAWAMTAAEARRVEQEQQVLQEKQCALARQQEELLAEFQRRQQQQLEQQREHTRLQVAVRFHTLYLLHSALRTWHKNASITAALRKLHPKLPLSQPQAAAAAAAGRPDVEEGGAAAATPEGQTAATAAVGVGAPAGCDGRDTQGLLDPAVIQHKAQLLLQHLSNRAAAGEGQQQQQQLERPQQQTIQQSLQKQQKHPVALTVKKGPAGAEHKVAGVQPQQKQPQKQRPQKQQQNQQHKHSPVEASRRQQQQQQQATAMATAGKAVQAVRKEAYHNEQHDGIQAAAAAAVAAAAPLQAAATSATAIASNVERAQMSTVQGSLQPSVAAVAPECVVPSSQLQGAAAVGKVQDSQIGPSSSVLEDMAGGSNSSTPASQQQQQQQQGQGQQQPVLTAAARAKAVGLTAGADASACKLPAQQVGQPNTGQPEDDVPAVRVVDGSPATNIASVLQQQQQQQRRRQTRHSSPGRALSKQQQQQQQQQRRQSQPGVGPFTKQPHTDLPPNMDEQQQQQLIQQQEDWPTKRARLQQQLRQLQAEEQRRHRQYQQVEQQLQALLSQQCAELAAVHAARVLVRRAGLGPWLGLMKLRGQRWQLAGRLYQWHLLTAGMGGLKHALVCRHKRHTCQHIRAWGKLRAVCQQQQQRAALSALATWAITGQHYRRQLLLRCVCGWRGVAAEGTEVLGAAAEAMRGLRQCQVVRAWWQCVQDQAHDQLMVELELSSLANSWRTTRLQRCTLHCWRTNAAESVQQRLREAAHQQTWSRVRGWLSELGEAQQGPIGVCTAGMGAGGSAASMGAAWGGAVEVDVSGWDLVVDCEGCEGVVASGRNVVVEQVYQQQLDFGVNGDLGDVDWGEGMQDGGNVVQDLAALAEWFDAAERGTDADTVAWPSD